MITFSEALKRIENKIQEYNDEKEEIIVTVVLEDTIETEDYWIFFYNNVKFLETGNFSYSLIGNAPLIVDKYKGRIHVTGTANPLEFYIKQFEQTELPSLKDNTSGS